MAAFLFVTLYAAMAVAALAIEMLFQALGLIPAARNAQVVPTTITFNYTTILNLILLTISVLLVGRFLRTGGPSMLRMMDRAAATGSQQGHEKHSHIHFSP